MNAFLNCLKGIVLAPQKTFKMLVSDKKTKQYVLWIIVVQMIYGLVSNALSLPIRISHPTSITPLITRYIEQVSSYMFVIVPIVFTIKVFVFHGTARLFSNRGSVQKLFVMFGLSGITLSTITLLLLAFQKIQNVHLPLILFYVTYPWLVCLSIIALMCVYRISKKEACLIFLTELGITIVTVFLFVFIPLIVLLASGSFGSSAY